MFGKQESPAGFSRVFTPPWRYLYKKERKKRRKHQIYFTSACVGMQRGNTFFFFLSKKKQYKAAFRRSEPSFPAVSSLLRGCVCEKGASAAARARLLLRHPWRLLCSPRRHHTHHSLAAPLAVPRPHPHVDQLVESQQPRTTHTYIVIRCHKLFDSNEAGMKILKSPKALARHIILDFWLGLFFGTNWIESCGEQLASHIFSSISLGKSGDGRTITYQRIRAWQHLKSNTIWSHIWKKWPLHKLHKVCWF